MHFSHDPGLRPASSSTTRARSSRATGRVNTAAFAIHSQVHAARPDVVAAAHSHSLYGKAWSSLGRLLDPLTQDACAFYDDHALFDDYTGVVLDIEEGKRIAARARRPQGRHPAQPRPAHRRPHGRRGGVVVHHHGALVPGAAARRGRGHARPRSTTSRPRITAAQVGSTWPAGSASSRSTTASCGSSPTCSDNPCPRPVLPPRVSFPGIEVVPMSTRLSPYPPPPPTRGVPPGPGGPLPGPDLRRAGSAVGQVSVTEPLSLLGVESVNLISMKQVVEDDLGITIPLDVFLTDPSIADLADGTASRRFQAERRRAAAAADAADFTAEPVAETLSYWMDRLGYDAAVEFLPRQPALPGAAGFRPGCWAEISRGSTSS